MAKKENERSNRRILLGIKMELKRTLEKVDEAYAETGEPGYEDFYSHSKFAAAKRAAMDLKKELTKLTQSSKYKYGRDR